MCSGYYSYREGYTPEFPDRDRFQGTIIHPQQWPQDLDYRGKRVVVIGSGATAMTLVPAMAADAAHVVMLQRSPTYVVSRPDKDVIAKQPRIVVIQIGCNDARRVPRETFEATLNELHDKLKAAGIQAIQCTLTSVGEKHDGTNQHDAKMEEFAQIEREIAKSKDVPLNDLRKAFVAYWKEHNKDNQPSGILTYDGNHFNQTGHDFVAEQMLKKFR